MRLLVEALAAEYGGVRTYVDNLLAAWALAFPEDDVHVLLGAGHPAPEGVTAHHVRVTGSAVPVPAVLARPLAQTRAVCSLARSLRPDAVLASLPATTLRHPGVPLAVVVHDLRHEVRPGQFPAHRRLLRFVSYRRSYALADGFVTVSQRTLDDLERLHPSVRRVPIAVVHHGADHVDSWPASVPAGPDPVPAALPGGGHVVAFAHHTNKNLDLVLDGWAELGRSAPVLVVTGLGDPERSTLEGQLAARSLANVRLAPFLPDADFHQLVASASLVLFPSDFEGFGLPVVEAMRLGIPVVTGPEPATREVAAGHAFEMADFSPPALAAAVRDALAAPPGALQAARAHAAAFTWRRTASQTREFLASLP